ncbi:GntR family transcriptional regulator [Paenibacillus sacheonensis]|uniref:GntR family transcriptional regulator n=1 Tax=Paenibacillus sacheonensis TaxID=742054 RepID=A0A7X4YKQ8_9BACL|nr:GntR family transcriptional regulator [Paenibacillus sacheonensis]MBM7564199.1 DNA-binding GntR family transcriptional regulator [Paenibacillus sacheonensis]NBC67476.1 GntR family transcriptional regulator [Paenibacillus sacheonensis]
MESDNGQKMLDKLVVSNMWDQTYHILKENILSRRFRANEKLLIPQLAEQLGVSRTPIRDALNRLEMEGLVRTVSKVGTFVSPVQESHVNDIMDSRLMIDLWTLEGISKMGANELAERMTALDSIMAQAAAAAAGMEHFDPLQSRYDLEFHLAFVGLGGNLKNVELYKSLMNVRYLNLGERHITPAMVRQAFEQHLAVYRAVVARDFAAAKQAIGAHLSYSRHNILAVIQENGGTL